MSKQMRVPDAQYNILAQLETVLGTSRTDILVNIIRFAKIMIDNDVVRMKVINKDGEEKEMIWVMVREDAEEKKK